MKNNLKKLLIVFTLLFTLGVFILILSACDTKSPTAAELSSACIRIHIRANSNSDVDQSVKLKVRNEVTDYLSDKLANCKDKSEAQKVLNLETPNLLKIADDTLKENGFGYKSSIKMGKEYFPERVYDDYVFPEGTYDALVINLGSGKGDNWWCVAFPPLCFIPDSGGEKIVYKSWIKEMLDKIFSENED